MVPKNNLSRILSLAAFVISLNVALASTQAQPKPKSLSDFSRETTKNLDQKRYVAAGDRAYIIGTGDGRFPPLGWHIPGEMGGVWSHPIKLLDGYQFAFNDAWFPSAQKLIVKPGYIEMDYGLIEGFEVRRIEFAPDGLPVVLVGLSLKNPNSLDKTLKLTLEALSELMAVYPWANSQPSNAKTFNLKDEVTYNSTEGTITFREPGKPWFAIIGTSEQESSTISILKSQEKKR